MHLSAMKSLLRVRHAPNAFRKWAIAGLLPATLLTGCCCFVPRREYCAVQHEAMRLCNENSTLSAELGSTQQHLAQLEAENQRLQLAASQLGGSLDIANQRLLNLQGERSQLHDKYRNLLTGFPPQGPALPGSALDRFRALAEKYSDFEFDPVTGVSKFTGNLLFDVGSDQLRPASHELLREFAGIINDPSASGFKILVVGHTDDQPIRKASTRQKHPTNWDLSAHRATAVVKQLASSGVREQRMGVAGYSMFQPKGPNVDDVSRQQNRRVEIYILADEESIAGTPQYPN
ncbi:MAG: OmpA family protein [Planctomycetaceae bacterium]